MIQEIYKKNKFLTIIFAVLIVIFVLSVRAGWLPFLLLFAGVIIFNLVIIKKTITDEKSRRFILILFTLLLFTRILYITTYYFYSIRHDQNGYYYQYAYVRGNDEHFYHQSGMVIADKFIEDPFFVIKEPEFLYKAADNSLHVGYSLFTAFIYLICGSKLIFLKLLNALFSSTILTMIFLIAWENFGENVAKFAALLVAADTYALWFSASTYRETFMAFLFVLFCWSAYCYAKKGGKVYLLTAGASAIMSILTRSYFGAPMLFGLIIYFLIFKAPKQKFYRTVYVSFLVLIILPLVFFAGKFAYDNLKAGAFSSAEAGQVNQQWASDSESEESVSVAAAFSPKRLVTNSIRMFFSPIPWKNMSGKQEDIFYLGYPGRWLWYIFMPFLFIGTYFMLRKNIKVSLASLIALWGYILSCIIIMNAVERSHIPIMPFIFMICVVGFCQIKDAIWPYLIYIPILCAFFCYENKILMQIIPLIGLLSLFALICIIMMIQKELTFKRLFRILSGAETK